MPIPANPKIYHITPIDALAEIVQMGFLFSSSIVDTLDVEITTIGISTIKESRKHLPVHCHAGTCVGDYVPFYFCPRSVMLYLIYRANHPELAYRGGQERIVHLELDLYTVIDWADANDCLWAFSLSNAAARYAQFRASLDNLGEINWEAVAATDWRNLEIREAKQAEFLVHQFVPWHLVSRIGVISTHMGNQTLRAIGQAEHRPRIEVCRSWYY